MTQHQVVKIHLDGNRQVKQVEYLHGTIVNIKSRDMTIKECMELMASLGAYIVKQTIGR